MKRAIFAGAAFCAAISTAYASGPLHVPKSCFDRIMPKLEAIGAGLPDASYRNLSKGIYVRLPWGRHELMCPVLITPQSVYTGPPEVFDFSIWIDARGQLGATFGERFAHPGIGGSY